MAVLREWRGRGVGAAAHGGHAPASARALPVPDNAPRADSAAGFYRRFGFSERGGEFLEAGIPHVEMTLELYSRARVSR